MFFFSKLLLCTIQNFWTWFLIYLFTSVPLINVLIILYVTKPFKADRCWINLLQFCFKETENTVLFFQVSHAIWIVLSHLSSQGAESRYLQEWITRMFSNMPTMPSITFLKPELPRLFSCILSSPLLHNSCNYPHLLSCLLSLWVLSACWKVASVISHCLSLPHRPECWLQWLCTHTQSILRTFERP